MLNVFISSMLQLTLFAGVPWIFYLIFNKKNESYFKWIGLYLPNNKLWIKNCIKVFIISVLIMVGPILILQHLDNITLEMTYMEELSGKGLHFNVIIIIILKAIVQTSLSEEILFRGFIGKRIANKFGYFQGNIVQGILFGLPHGLPFIIVFHEYTVGFVLLITASIVGFLQFYLNEKKADGSIIPSFIVHGIMNLISFTSKALSL